MLNTINKFINSESGAVTVDFVVLTAAIAGLGLAVAVLILPNLKPVVSGMQPALDNAPTLGKRLILGE